MSDYGRFGAQLQGVGRCPHCSTANPTLMKKWQADHPLPRADGGQTSIWAVFACTTCGQALLAKGIDGASSHNATIDRVIPEPKSAHEDIPEPARTFLQQAYETMHAPDAAAVMAGSAVDAMLKAHELTEGSVYNRIDQARDQHILTEGMADWAHEVRLGANRPRHADVERPHVTPEEAKQSVEFAEALGYFLFVLTRRIARGTELAKQAAESEGEAKPASPKA